MLRYDGPTDPRLEIPANDNGSDAALAPELSEPVASLGKPGRLFSRPRSYAATAGVRKTPRKPSRTP